MSVIYSSEARKYILSGISQMARAVAVTLGPRGRNVCLQKNFGDPLLTKDGVSVAKEIELPNRWENMGAGLLRDVASRTSDNAGDGTTTAIVIAHYLCVEGVKLVEAKIPPVSLKRGIEKAVSCVLDCIDAQSKPIKTQKDIAQIATISSNGDTRIGNIIAEAVAKVGKDGVINIEEGKGLDIKLTTVDGMKIDRGWAHAELCFDPERQESILDNPIVFVCADPVNALSPMISFLDAAVKTNRPLLVIAPDFGGEALPTFIKNTQSGNLKSVCVKAPSFGEKQRPILDDIAILTGATLVARDVGILLDSISLEMMGAARRVRVTSKETVISDGAGSQEAVDRRVLALRSEMERSGSDYDADKLKERISKLLGGICTIEVGGHTELQVKEVKARLEDALYATKASLDEGIVTGGGLAYLRAAEAVRALLRAGDEVIPTDANELLGFRLVLDACAEPMKQLVRNTGASGTAWVDRVLAVDDTNVGIDITQMKLVDLFEAGIVDPAKVVRNAVANAASVAGTLLMTEAVIRKNVPKKPADSKA